MPAIIGGLPTFTDPIPLVKPLLPSLGEIEADLAEILNTGILSKGRHVAALEARAAEELGVKHAIAVSSCTTGLMLAYQALELTGDAIVPSFTFMSTVGALGWAGLRPVFADVEPHTMNLSADAARAAITAETTAIVAVHSFGNPCDIDRLEAVAAEFGLRLVFDAAHGFGSRYDGRPLGAQGDAQVFSLSPTKLVVAGEGGIVATNNDGIAAKIRIGREFGNRGDYDSDLPGLNGRLPEISALIATHSLRHLETAVESRARIANLYQERLAHVPGITFQRIRATDRSAYKDFAILIDPESFGLTRDQLAITLSAENIETRAYFSPSAHQQRAYRRFAQAVELPITEALSANILCLPIWNRMDSTTCADICRAILSAHQFADSIGAQLNETSNAGKITAVAK